MSNVVALESKRGAMETPLGQVDQYNKWLRAQGLAANTVDLRVRHHKRFIDDFEDLRTVEGHDVADWLATYVGWTRRTYQASFNSVFRWMVETGQRVDNPCDRIRNAPSPRPRPKPLSRDEVSRILRVASGDQRAWILLALLAGLRAHEIAKIRGEDVTADTIAVVGKGSSVEEVETHPDLWILAQNYPRTGRWFPDATPKSVSDHTGTLFHALDISGSIHRARATFGTALIKTHPINVVQGLLRHKSLASTQHYLGVDSDERRRAITGLDVAS